MNFIQQKWTRTILCIALLATGLSGCTIQNMLKLGMWTHAQANAQRAEKKGDYSEAERLLKEACSLAHQDGLMEKAELFQSRSELGFVYQHLNKQTDAKAQLEEALSLANDLWKENDERFPFDAMNGTRFARVLNELASMDAENNQRSTAYKLFMRASIMEHRFLPNTSSEITDKTVKGLQSVAPKTE